MRGYALGLSGVRDAHRPGGHAMADINAGRGACAWTRTWTRTWFLSAPPPVLMCFAQHVCVSELLPRTNSEASMVGYPANTSGRLPGCLNNAALMLHRGSCMRCRVSRCSVHLRRFNRIAQCSRVFERRQQAFSYYIFCYL